ncbi:hypothetical protein [Microbacterium suwonense]|nr:hypothetical protein [Microbacterium suwonense]
MTTQQLQRRGLAGPRSADDREPLPISEPHPGLSLLLRLIRTAEQH